jgi:hypothetical protein
MDAGAYKFIFAYVIFVGFYVWFSPQILVSTNTGSGVTGSYTTNATYTNTSVVKACGTDVFCNIGNFVTLTTLNSSYALLNILIFMPALFVIGLIIINTLWP